MSPKKTSSYSLNYSYSVIKQFSSKLETFQSERKWKLCAFEELPPWLQTNEYLHHGHRPPLDDYSTCFKSMFSWHTETGNIWTHIFGFILNLIMISSHFQHYLTNYTSDRWIILCFFGGTFICFLMSTLFHAFNCHSLSMNTILARIDYTGIYCQIFGSAVPLMYFR
jgi:adiponectin receptor